MRKALCSIGSGAYAKLLALSSRTFAAYAARHDYDLVLRHDADDASRHPAWSKVPLILQLLEEYDLVLWLDADAIIVELQIDIAAERRPDRWMYLARLRTCEGVVPNTGVWMVTSCEEAKRFLRIVNAHEAYTNHKWWENAAVIDLLGYAFDPLRPNTENQFTAGVEYLDHCWNSIAQDTAESPRIKHYPGLPLCVREQHLRADLDSFRSLELFGSELNRDAEAPTHLKST